MIALLIVFVATGLVLVAFGARLGPRAFYVGAVPCLAATVWTVANLARIVAGGTVEQKAAWASSLGLEIDLRLDGLTATMSLVVAGIGVLVMVYAAHYFARDARDLGRLAGLLVLFGGSMLGLVWANHVILLYTCWELTSITSFLLIGNRHSESRARAAALQALLITGAGGLALFAGLLLIAQEAGTFVLTTILEHPPGPTPTITVAIVLVLVGVVTKSAQYPFHFWLPGAMAAPTPVSTYLHSATMVKAGVFLLSLTAPVFATTGAWRPLVIAAGCSSLVFGGLRALRQHDLKLLLAFGTVSQLGLLVVLFGIGTPAAATAGWVLLVAHAAFKATLFMVVGIIDHQTGTRDFRELPPLGKRWRGVEIVTLLAVASMAGVPLGAGFVAKELTYGALDDVPFAGGAFLLAVVVVGAMLTVAYSIRFYWCTFVEPRRRAFGEPTPAAPSKLFVAPATVCAAVGLVLGVAPGLADGLLGASLSGFGGAVVPVHLSVWHGLGLPVLLSVVALGGGVVLAAGDRWLQPWLARGGRIPSGAEIYLASLRGLGVVSTRVTGVVQSGSLPAYSDVILLTAAVLPAGALLAAGVFPGWPPLGSLSEVPIVGLLLVAALGAAIVHRRFAAALFLSVAGYAMAGLFVVSGAPDLALTQVAVETLSTVVFVLVLRRLPERFESESTRRRRIVRILIASAVGASVFAFALTAAGFRAPPDVSDEMVARSVPDGHGENVVNVILVDFRGFDTLGEITVLAVASIGAVALTRVGGIRTVVDPTPNISANTDVRRLAFVDVSVRIVVHAVVLMSIWLLLSGHDQPGGGFVGGLLAGSAITLRYIAGGIDEIHRRSRFRPWTILGTGLLLAATTALLPVLRGESVLEVSTTTLDLPTLGSVGISSALVFDIGVYLAVVGMVLMAFEAFGEGPTEVAA